MSAIISSFSLPQLEAYLWLLSLLLLAANLKWGVKGGRGGGGGGGGDGESTLSHKDGDLIL